MATHVSDLPWEIVKGILERERSEIFINETRWAWWFGSLTEKFRVYTGEESYLTTSVLMGMYTPDDIRKEYLRRQLLEEKNG